MQPPLRKSAPGPPNISDAHVSCTAPATRNACLQIPFKCPTPATAFETVTKPSRFAHFWQGAQSLAPATQNASERPKVLRPVSFLHVLTSTCTSRHNGVHFFDMSTAKSALRMVCFVHFDFEMRFAPQRHTLFRHVDCQKCSKNGVLCTFWLRHVLRATTACNCSSLIWPDGSAPAALASLLFDLRNTNHWKNTVTRDLSTFSHFRAPASSFFWLFLFSDLLASSLLFSDSSHLCFFICPYCRKLYVHRCKYKCLFSKNILLCFCRCPTLGLGPGSS